MSHLTPANLARWCMRWVMDLDLDSDWIDVARHLRSCSSCQAEYVLVRKAVDVILEDCQSSWRKVVH